MPHKTLRGSLNQHQMFSNTFNEKHEMLKKNPRHRSLCPAQKKLDNETLSAKSNQLSPTDIWFSTYNHIKTLLNISTLVNLNRHNLFHWRKQNLIINGFKKSPSFPLVYLLNKLTWEVGRARKITTFGSFLPYSAKSVLLRKQSNC